MRKKIELVILLLLLAVLVWLNRALDQRVSADKAEKKEVTILIDAGHGGRDPGKVGREDVLEKDLNLQIAMKLKEKLESEKYKVIMTREADRITGEDCSKVEDLRKRVSFINSNRPTLAVSIHQNSYSDERVHGAQVFYYESSEEGRAAAEEIQRCLCETDTTNKRVSKGNSSYFLLKKTKSPIIIVECGFLSNYEETKKLQDENYQGKLVEAIVTGIKNYLLKTVGNQPEV